MGIREIHWMVETVRDDYNEVTRKIRGLLGAARMSDEAFYPPTHNSKVIKPDYITPSVDGSTVGLDCPEGELVHYQLVRDTLELLLTGIPISEQRLVSIRFPYI